MRRTSRACWWHPKRHSTTPARFVGSPRKRALPFHLSLEFLMHLKPRWGVLIVATAILLACSQAPAGKHHFGILGQRGCWPDCVGPRCCDDYCGKPLPCPTKVGCFECPDYCRKPLPCAAPAKQFCCDDYCPKRLPPVCRPPAKHLQCVPTRLPPTKQQVADANDAASPARASDQRPAFQVSLPYGQARPESVFVAE